MFLRACAVLALACGCRGSGSSPGDSSGVDSGPADEGRDISGSDGVVVDSGDASTPVDDAPDAFVVDSGPFKGTWKVIGGGEFGCTSLLAVDPSVVPVPAWKECPSKRAGCSSWISDWSEHPGATLAFQNEAARSIGGKSYFTYVMSYPTSPYQYPKYSINVVHAIDGPQLLATGSETSPASCGASLRLADVGPVVQGLSKSWGGARLVALSTWSAPSAVGPFIPLKYSELLDGGVGRVQELNVVAGRAYAEVKVPDKVVAFDLSSRSTIGETALRAEAPVAGTDGAFAITLGPYGLAHIDLSGRVNQVLTVPSPRVVVYPVVDHSPPTSLVWLEATLAGGEPTEGALWASPYATDGAALKPRKLITLAPPLPRVVANAGLVLWRESNTTARVLRVSDGSTWTMTGETGRAFTGALWVTADEAWLATADASLPSPGSYTSGVMRLRRELWTSP